MRKNKILIPLFLTAPFFFSLGALLVQKSNEGQTRKCTFCPEARIDGIIPASALKEEYLDFVEIFPFYVEDFNPDYTEESRGIVHQFASCNTSKFFSSIIAFAFHKWGTVPVTRIHFETLNVEGYYDEDGVFKKEGLSCSIIFHYVNGHEEVKENHQGIYLSYSDDFNFL